VKRKVSGIYCLLVAFFGLVFLQAEEARGGIFSFFRPTAVTNIDSLSGIVSQKYVGNCACGPCAIFNAFQLGGAPFNRLAATLPGDAPASKVRALIQLYGDKPSRITPAEPRYLATGGMWDADVAPFINDWLASRGVPPVTGECLTLQNHETSQDYLERVYGELSHSLAAGFPPVVNLQSFAARRSFFHPYWKWMDGHFVTVVAVQDSLAGDATGFTMWVADSESGRVLRVFVHANPNQPETILASSRTQRSGKRSGRSIEPWTGAYPYLMIQSPKLQSILAGDSANSSSIVCVLQYIAHR
jgi:hypothetical protein